MALHTCSFKSFSHKVTSLAFNKIAYRKHSTKETVTANISERLSCTLLAENLKNFYVIKIVVQLMTYDLNKNEEIPLTHVLKEIRI